MYLPTDFDNTYCYYCPFPCTSCKGTYNNPTCTSCYDGYELSGGKCLQNCKKGNNQSCKSCNTQPGKIDRCLDCNDGYYLPEDDYDDYYYYYYNNYKRICSNCPTNCIKCNGKNGYNPDCTQCETGYYLVENEEMNILIIIIRAFIIHVNNVVCQDVQNINLILIHVFAFNAIQQVINKKITAKIMNLLAVMEDAK